MKYFYLILLTLIMYCSAFLAIASYPPIWFEDPNQSYMLQASIFVLVAVYAYLEIKFLRIENLNQP